MLYAVVAIVAFLIASYTDIKKREVPELLTTGLIALGLCLHAIDSVLVSNPSPLVSSVYMAVLAFAFAFFLYKIGAWAGGDVKLFTGLGAILPAYGRLDYFPFLVFTASFLATLPFIMLYISYFFVRVKKLRKLIKPVLFKDFRRAVYSSAYIVASYQIAALSHLHWGFTAPIVYVLYKIGLFAVPFVVILLIFSFLADQIAFLTYFAYLFAISFLLLFGIHSFGIAREHILRRTVKTSQLEEGMIPAEDIYIKNVKVADSKMANGLSIEEIKKLRKARNAIKIKLSIPFVPVITLGLILLLFLEKVIK